MKAKGGVTFRKLVLVNKLREALLGRQFRTGWKELQTEVSTPAGSTSSGEVLVRCQKNLTKEP